MVLTMSKSRDTSRRGDGKNDGKSDGKPPKKNLNVKLSTGEFIAKIAALRGLNMEEFFEEKDVQTFFSHLFAVEIEKEARQLKGRS
jgi:hypothetical protein